MCIRLFMVSMTRYSMAEFRMQKGMSPSHAWEEVQTYYTPKAPAATPRLKRELETICMVGGEDRVLFLL